ncbi:MAG: sigma-70 family RNA polymerase sigma factor [Clostridia bacterium]|nr:sigma-70 family RNA polymerase sigma factor [Clostridia bacterium]
MKKIDKDELHILFEGIKSSNKDAFDTFYEKYKSLVFGIAFTVCKSNDIADEVTQNVFFKIWKLSSEKLPTSCEASWLYTITKNETIDFLRKNTSYVDIDSIYNIENSNNDVAGIVDIDSYNRKISFLPEQEKQIISLKLLYNFTFKEIGELLNIPTATAQWKYYKSINSLKLAITSLAMFILTFAIYLKTRFTSNNKITKSQASSESDINKSKDSNSNLPSINMGETAIDSITTDSYTAASSNKNPINYTNGILCISSVFLILTIIFTIIFKKYQQKLKSKTSKHYMNK